MEDYSTFKEIVGISWLAFENLEESVLDKLLEKRKVSLEEIIEVKDIWKRIQKIKRKELENNKL
jgi:hypothetical protein